MLLIPVTCSSVKYSNFCVKSSYIFTDVLSPPGGSPHSCDGGLRRGVFYLYCERNLVYIFGYRLPWKALSSFLTYSYIFPSYKPLKTWALELGGNGVGPRPGNPWRHMRSEVRVCALRSNLYREVKPSTEFVRSDSFLSKTRAFGTKASSSAEKRQTRRTTTGRRPRLEARPPSPNACEEKVV